MFNPAIVPLIANLVIALLSAVFAAGGAYLAVRVKLHYMERNIDRNTEDIREWRTEFKRDIDSVHSRINQVRNDCIGKERKSG